MLFQKQLSNSDNRNSLDYESKVYAISNEGGNVKYHVNEAANSQNNSQAPVMKQPGFATTSLNLTTSDGLIATGNTSTTRSVRNTSVELPLSVLNAALLTTSQGQGR